MGYIGSDPKTNEAVNTAQLVDDSVTNAKIVDNIQFTSVTASVISASSTVTADSFTGTFNGALSSSAQIASNISGSFSQSHLSSKITGIISGAAQLPSGTVSASVLSSPSQGTVRLTTNGVNTDVDTGLQVGDSPTFAGGTISGDFSVGGTLTAQEVHTEFESASILFTSGSTQFGNSLDDNHVFSGSLLITGSLVQLQGGSTKLRFSNDVGAERAFLQLNGTGLNIDTDSFIDFKPNNTFAARIDSSGKLGISTTFGENIASSVNKFAVRSDTSSTHYNMVNIWEHTNTTTGIEQRIGWAFGDDGGAEDGFGFAGYIGVGKQDSWQVDSTRDSYMSFATALNNSVSEKMRIDSSGNVGIGNTVASTINSANNGGRLVIGDGSGNEGMTIYSGNGSGEYGILYFADGTSGASTYQGWLAYFQDVNALTFATSGTERMRIDSSGRVGIGTVSPSGSLHVQAANPTVYITNTTQDGTSTLLRMTEKKEVDGDAGGFLRYVGSNNWFEIGTNISSTDTVHLYLPRDGSGAVGIGTNNPNADRLSLYQVGSTTAGARTFEVGYPVESSAGINGEQYMQTILNTSNSGASNGLAIGVKHDDAHALIIGKHDETFDHFVVNGNGLVGIGTATPDGFIDVFTGSTRLFRVQSDGVAVGSANPGTYGQFHVRGTGDTSVTGSAFWDGYGDIGLSGNVVGPHTMCLQSTFTATQHMGPSIIFRAKAGSVLDTSTVAAIVGSLNVDPSGNSVETRGALRFFTSDGYQYNPQYGSAMIERMLIDHTGNIMMTSQRRNASFNQDGLAIGNSNGAFMYIERSEGTANSIIYTHRRNGDGQHISFYESNAQDGYIQTSSGVVSLVGFQGSHEASGIPNNTPTGTVVSTIDEEFKYRHANVKISDTVGDKRVYGVVENFNKEQSDDTGHTHPAHFNIASVGVGHIRVTGSCAGGDLLESNGDGLAKVQDDDIIRSKTIGKVTANVSGSATEDRLVACVLYCG